MTTKTDQARPSILDDPARIGGIAGVAFVALFIVGAVVTGSSPTYGDSAATIRTYFTNHAGQYVVGQWITAIGVVFGLLPFAIAVRIRLGKVDTSGGLWARLAFAGALVWVVLAGANTATFNALALDKAKGIDDSSLLLVNALADVGFALAGLGLGLLTAAASVVIWRTGVFWRWLAVLGLVSTVLVIVGDLVGLRHSGTGTFDASGMFGEIGAAIFILVLSIMMVAGKGGETA